MKIWICLLFFVSTTAFAQESENPGTHLITIDNKLDGSNIAIEVYQENLRASVHTPVIKEKGEIALEPVMNYEIKIAPGDSANVEVRAKGTRTRGHFIAHVRPDLQVTIYAYEMKDQNSRTPQSERYPAVCNLGKPGDGDEEIEITKSRVNEGLSCRPKKKAAGPLG